MQLNATTEHALSHLAAIWVVTVQLYAIATMFVVFKFHDTEALEPKNIQCNRNPRTGNPPLSIFLLCLFTFMRLIYGFLRLLSENISIGYVIWRHGFIHLQHGGRFFVQLSSYFSFHLLNRKKPFLLNLNKDDSYGFLRVRFHSLWTGIGVIFPHCGQGCRTGYRFDCKVSSVEAEISLLKSLLCYGLGLAYVRC